ncbi:MAG: AI-2E family transporter [Rhodothermales bacterium]
MPADPNRTLRRLVAVLVVIFVVAALKATKPVTMPLAFALFTVILFWPLYKRLDKHVPTGVALVATLLAVFAVLGAFVGAIWFTVDEVLEGIGRYEQEFASLRASVASFFGAIDGGSGESASLSSDRIVGFAERLASNVWSVLGYLVLVIALFTLAIVEVDRWKQKLRRRFDDPFSADAIGTAAKIAAQVQRFLLVQSFTALLTGVLTGLLCWAMGIDFALLWGLLAFVLNFIPTLGSLVAVVPPVLFALLQYGIGWQAPALLAGLGLIEIVLGAYVDPKLQGRYLELSALVVLVAITFWGWLWGIPGAFIAVPITAAAVLVFKHIPQTEWVARLLTRAEEDEHSLTT